MFKTKITSTKTADDTLNLQYSIEGGVIGFDWVPLGARNRADKIALKNFIRRRKHKVETRKMNGVTYLRVEDGDIIKLGASIVHDFYDVGSEYPMGLLVSGFVPPSQLDRYLS